MRFFQHNLFLPVYFRLGLVILVYIYYFEQSQLLRFLFFGSADEAWALVRDLTTEERFWNFSIRCAGRCCLAPPSLSVQRPCQPWSKLDLAG